MTELLKPLHLLQHEEGKTAFFFMADAFYNQPIMAALCLKIDIDRDYFNGYAWAKVILKLINAEFAENVEEIVLDPEADMFSALSENHALMQRLALRFQALMHNEKALMNLLERT